MTLPGTGTVSNNQCSIVGLRSSVFGNGNTLTLTLGINFGANFGGNRIVYGAAGNGRQNSGWQPIGTVGQ